MSNHGIDIARALKDEAYFNGLTDQEKALVRQANPVGEGGLSDDQLDTVSGGLGGGDRIESTTTTTDLKVCSCDEASFAQNEGCTCAC
jgi:mersacidin/lichenicidin family type 2 lantibiotic